MNQLFIPKGLTLETRKSKPFHIYHEDFLDIVGENPTLTLIADSGTDPLFHEAPIWSVHTRFSSFFSVLQTWSMG